MSINLLNSPIKVATKWLKDLNKPTKDNVSSIVNELLFISANTLNVHKTTYQTYKEFTEIVNKTDALKFKFGNPDENITTGEAIENFKNLCHDIIFLAEQQPERKFYWTMAVFVGCYLWLQMGVKFNDIVKVAGQKDMLTTKSEKEAEEIVTDDLPYFGQGKASRDDDKKAVRRLVKKAEAEHDEEEKPVRRLVKKAKVEEEEEEKPVRRLKRREAEETKEDKQDNSLNVSLKEVKRLVKIALRELEDDEKPEDFEKYVPIILTFTILKSINFDFFALYDAVLEAIKEGKI